MTKEEMTNEISVEEAIEVFKFMKRDVLEESKEDKVLDMAIKALEQQPCEDCISRESVIKIIENKLNPCTDMFKCLEMSEIKEDVGHLPSVTPSNDAIREAYIKGYDYGVKDWFKAKTEPCDDCISREDALKAIEEQKKGFYGVERYAIDECHSAVMKLPSVRPYREIVEDKRACEKCIHYVTRDSKGVVLCGCDSWECDFEEVKT